MSKSLTFSVLLLAFANFLNLSHFEMRQHPQMTQESHQHCLAGGTGKLYDTSHTYHEDNQDIKLLGSTNTILILISLRLKL